MAKEKEPFWVGKFAWAVTCAVRDNRTALGVLLGNNSYWCHLALMDEARLLMQRAIGLNRWNLLLAATRLYHDLCTNAVLVLIRYQASEHARQMVYDETAPFSLEQSVEELEDHVQGCRWVLQQDSFLHMPSRLIKKNETTLLSYLTGCEASILTLMPLLK